MIMLFASAYILAIRRTGTSPPPQMTRRHELPQWLKRPRRRAKLVPFKEDPRERYSFGSSRGCQRQPARQRAEPDRPEPAQRPCVRRLRHYPAGVVTRSFADAGRADIIAAQEAEGDMPRAARTLTTGIWVPAAAGATPGITRETELRDGRTPVSLSAAPHATTPPLSGHFR